MKRKKNQKQKQNRIIKKNDFLIFFISRFCAFQFISVSVPEKKYVKLSYQNEKKKNIAMVSKKGNLKKKMRC